MNRLTVGRFSGNERTADHKTDGKTTPHHSAEWMAENVPERMGFSSSDSALMRTFASQHSPAHGPGRSAGDQCQEGHPSCHARKAIRVCFLAPGAQWALAWTFLVSANQCGGGGKGDGAGAEHPVSNATPCLQRSTPPMCMPYTSGPWIC